MADNPALAEYLQLRDEKVGDWRLITQISLTTLATTAALAVGGLSAHSRLVVVAAPIPFYLGVLYLVQSAWLQTRQNTFLASRAPAGSLNYEKAVLEARASDDAPEATWLGDYRWWIIVAGVLGCLFSAFPFVVGWDGLSGFEASDRGWVCFAGLVLLGLFTCAALGLQERVNAAQKDWVAYWEKHPGAS